MPASWAVDGAYNSEHESGLDLRMLPLGMLDGKPVFTGDAIEDGPGDWTPGVAHAANRNFTNCRWPAPPRTYPVTLIAAAELDAAWTGAEALRRVANAALRHAIDAGQLIEPGDRAARDMAVAVAVRNVAQSARPLARGYDLSEDASELVARIAQLDLAVIIAAIKREVFLSVEEVRMIAEHCTEQAQATIWAALLTGARRGELFQIRREDIGVDSIRLPASHTKTLKTRVIPIIPALRPWLKYFPLTITVDGLKSSWRRARVKARMEHVNFHDLRHSCASIMLGLGVDLYTISKILGHSNVQTTQRYAHLQIDAQRAALDKLSALVQKK